MTKLCLMLLTMLALTALGGCSQYYAQEMEVKDRFGEPDMVKYVCGDNAQTVLYPKPKPSEMGTLDQQIWYYVNKNMAVAFHDDTYSEPHQVSIMESIMLRRTFAQLKRQQEPPKDVNVDSERPEPTTFDPSTIQQP